MLDASHPWRHSLQTVGLCSHVGVTLVAISRGFLFSTHTLHSIVLYECLMDVISCPTLEQRRVTWVFNSLEDFMVK